MKRRKFDSVAKDKLFGIGVGAFRYLFLISVSYIIVFQLAYMISYAFRPSSEMYDASVVWVTKNWSLENFKVALSSLNYLKSFFITLVYQILSGLIQVITCAIPAYGFARFKFKGKNILFACVLITILVPQQMIAVPMSLNYSHFDFFGIIGLVSRLFKTEIRPNLLETGFVFWLPSLFGAGLRSGLFIFIYQQFFRSLPKELEEAAALDGANAFSTFTRIIIPSSGVAMLTVTIFSIVWHWNDYYYSIIYFNENYPLAVKLSQLTATLATSLTEDNRGVRMAGCLLFILPILILYVFLQRNFIKSIDRVGIVG